LSDLSHRPEIDLLIASAFPPGHPEQGVRLRSMKGGLIDWSKLGALSAYHRVKPLLYKTLIDQDLVSVPGSVMTELAEECRGIATRNLQLTGELIGLTKSFVAAGIPVLPHKGPLLAAAAYGDLALREFADIDLLIHASDLPRAITLLAEQGYHAPEKLGWLSPSALMRWSAEMTYHSARGVAVDLHWRLTPSHYTVQLDPEILWRSCSSITLAGSQIPTIAPEALLLLLAVHGAKHCWESLGWLADVAWLLNAQPDLEWKHVLAMARESKCDRPFLLCASLVHEVFESPIPETVMKGIEQDRAVGQLHQRVIERWLEGPLESPRSPELYSFATILARRRSDSIRHLLGSVFYPTEADWSDRRLSEKHFWIYGGLRAVRLLGKYVFRR
jgi:Uncharacterised nucleotidyltransferase